MCCIGVGQIQFPYMEPVSSCFIYCVDSSCGGCMGSFPASELEPAPLSVAPEGQLFLFSLTTAVMHGFFDDQNRRWKSTDCTLFKSVFLCFAHRRLLLIIICSVNFEKRSCSWEIRCLQPNIQLIIKYTLTLTTFTTWH